MPQTTIRIPDGLLSEIDEATSEEQSRSEWIREACRAELSGDDLPDRVDDLEQRVTELEDQSEQSLLAQVFG